MLTAQVWVVLDKLRNRGLSLTLPKIISELKSAGITLTFDDVLDLGPLLQSHYDWFIPRSLLSFFAAYVAARGPSTVLDPCARWGAMLLSTHAVDSISKRVGITQNLEELATASYIDADHKVEWVTADSVSGLAHLDNQFDMVISCPPWGTRHSSPFVQIGDVVIKDDLGSSTLAMATSKLGKQGRLFAVMGAGFLIRKNLGFYEQLEKLDLGIEALIHFPGGFFANAQVDGYCVLLQKGLQTKSIFVGELSNDESHNEVLLKNLLALRADEEMSLGTIFTGAAFPGYRQLVAENSRRTIARKMGLSASLLSEIISAVNLTKRDDPADFPPENNVIYLPLIGKSRAKTSPDQLTLKAHNYAQLVFKPDRAFAPFMAGYFNSAIGLMSREIMQTGAFIPELTKASLLQVDVFIPTLVEQVRCVEIDTEAANILAEVGGIREALWSAPRKYSMIREALHRVNREDTFDSWLDTLPFPLASILWSYHASGNDDKARYERLIQFFEAFVQFLAVTFWSVSRNANAVSSDNRYPLSSAKPVNYPVERSSFGTWYEIAARLSKFYRTLLNSGKIDREIISSAFGTLGDTSLLEMLFSSRLIEVCMEVNKLRNTLIGHTGIVGAEDARQRRTLMETHLSALRTVVGTRWSELPLYKAGSSTLRGGLRTYEAERVMGRATPFEKVTFESLVEIEDGALFFAAIESKIPITLAPLVVIAASPRSAQIACYFYNRVDGSQMRFISYHFEDDAERFDADPSVRATLNELERLTESGSGATLN